MVPIWRAATLRAATLVMAIVGVMFVSAPATSARTFVGLHLSLPLYAGPPAYSPYYAPYGYPYYGPTYYAPPPVVVAPQSPRCREGLWRQDDGSVVRGVACIGADGNWRLAN